MTGTIGRRRLEGSGPEPERAVRYVLAAMVAWGAVAALAHLVGARSVGAALSFVHLGVLVGAPLALILGQRLRASAVVVAVSVALSFGVSALATQSALWFGLTHPAALVAMATAYGAVLALLLTEIGAGPASGSGGFR